MGQYIYIILHYILHLINADHVCVTLIVLFLGWFLAFASINLTVFDPVKKAFADFSMTDVYYEIQATTADNDKTNVTALIEAFHTAAENGEKTVKMSAPNHSFWAKWLGAFIFIWL